MDKIRRYDLDWLRVISVFAVFLHHVLMPFNGDGFHIINEESSKVLDDTMVYFEQFRLPLLFLVSGIGTVYAFSKRNWLSFMKERSKRLLIPLIFGVLVLVPPQIYFEFLNEHESFLIEYPTIMSKLEVNHLWFIENLFLMSLVFIPFIVFFNSNRSAKIKRYIRKVTTNYGLFLWVTLLIVIRVITKHYFPSDSKSFTNPSTTLYYSFFYASGIVISSTKSLWKVLLKNRRRNLIISLLCSLIFYGYYYIPNEYVSPYFSLTTRWHLWYIACSLVSWSVIICCLGYGQIFLNKRSKLLYKLNEAVYPFYMLHQTVIIAIGYYVLKIKADISVKIVVLSISSFFVITAIYLLCVYPFKWMRFLFGMKEKKTVLKN
ncbi:Peptidoglycan/LPS O-acetylase OafA/YrhL, contains acyltransferase and SGNH-hydrolase domains [Tenacibaculum sp. MAR_2009_124]|uniref:acyltransferase family protein n=1 Tax=Tenacibaculum sp. MAR_2009_124 TaxID=1250059 RepID=UPI0008983A02|nr:acyltransferase [Tenacibaculum sp. MAR_2009_124]SEB79013.1 Peptidoglycan/LPS O-acetylase OafA/YrhL, contains acyltransferase and SGNH-hydrolase domains [Tenacibaculum sp. MAR_2009_124]